MVSAFIPKLEYFEDFFRYKGEAQANSSNRILYSISSTKDLLYIEMAGPNIKLSKNLKYWIPNISFILFHSVKTNSNCGNNLMIIIIYLRESS